MPSAPHVRNISGESRKRETRISGLARESARSRSAGPAGGNGARAIARSTDGGANLKGFAPVARHIPERRDNIRLSIYAAASIAAERVSKSKASSWRRPLMKKLGVPFTPLFTPPMKSARTFSR
jgi:hypothetical protein